MEDKLGDQLKALHEELFDSVRFITHKLSTFRRYAQSTFNMADLRQFDEALSTAVNAGEKDLSKYRDRQET